MGTATLDKHEIEDQDKVVIGQTQRKDDWWLEPGLYALGLGAFIVYATWAAFQGNHYEFGPYLSPFYSPLIIVDWWSFSPAFFILWIPAGFRTTCYYYRKAYYRSYFLSPPACSVSEKCLTKYSGETAFPLIMQNLHRYFLYLSTALLFFLWHDVYKALWFEDGFGIGVGTVILFLTTLFLSLYTVSCHSFRHIIAGASNKLFKSEAHFKIFERVSCANEHHMAYAWTSLFLVGFADVYVRLCSMGVWTDVRLF